jgi:hypothetical protein
LWCLKFVFSKCRQSGARRKKEVPQHAIDVVIEVIPLEKYGVEEVK